MACTYRAGSSATDHGARSRQVESHRPTSALVWIGARSTPEPTRHSRVTAWRMDGVRCGEPSDGRISVHSLCAKVLIASIPATTIRGDRMSTAGTCRVRSELEPAGD